MADAPSPPLVKGWPLLGSTFQFLRDAPGVLNRAYRKYGPVFRLRALWIRYTIIGGKEAELFMQQGLPIRYLSREKIFHAIGKELGTDDFMMSQSGPTHLRLRRLLALGYSRESASAFVPDFIEAVSEEVRKWPAGSVRRVMEEVNRIAFEQYCRVMCGRSLREHFAEAMTTIETNMNVGGRVWPFMALKNPWYRKARNKVIGLISDMVRAAESETAGSASGRQGARKTIIDTMLSLRDKDGEPLRHDQVVCYAMYGCAGSVAYMARLVGFMLYQILIDPELKRILTEEADRAFSEAIRDASDVRRMELMCAVYHETLRFRPVSQGMPYYTDRAFVFRGKKVEAGDITVLSQVPMSFSEQYFTDPMRFDHTRMMSPRNEHRKGGGFHPFGLGDRTCTAMGLTELMAVTMVATILHERELEMTPAGYRLKLRVRPLPAPDGGFRIRTKPRHGVIREAAPSEESITAAFPGNDDPAVTEMLGAAPSRTFRMGEVIIRQGDTANAFYIVERGIVSVSKDGMVVARLAAGQYFGEIGLLHGVPRTATVAAESASVQVLELSRESFLELVEKCDLVSGEMAAIARKRTAHNVLRDALPGISADALERLFPEFSTEKVEAGATVIEEGDAADRFYVIAEGWAIVTRRADGGSEELARLGPGEYFGEMGLITDQPRNATVKISGEGPAVLLSTDRKGFLAMFHAGASGDLAQTMISRAAQLK